MTTEESACALGVVGTASKACLAASGSIEGQTRAMADNEPAEGAGEATEVADGDASETQASAEPSPEAEETTDADRAAAETVDENAEKAEGAE